MKQRPKARQATISQEFRTWPIEHRSRVRHAHQAHRIEALGLDLRAERGVLRFRDFASGQYLKSHAEATAAQARATKALARERAARAQEGNARRAAEARIVELEARLR